MHGQSADALSVAGVVGVVTGDDVTDLPDPFYGPAFKDQRLLPLDEVLYEGEAVAAVVADSEAAAEEGARRVVVGYEELPAVTDLDTALAPEATPVHRELRPAGHFRDLGSLKPVPGRLLAAITRVPTAYLCPVILMASLVGAYAVRENPLDPLMALAFGILGLLMERFGLPRLITVIAFILGPVAEHAFFQSLQISGDGWSIFVTRPVSALLVLLLTATFAAELHLRRRWGGTRPVDTRPQREVAR